MVKPCCAHECRWYACDSTLTYERNPTRVWRVGFFYVFLFALRVARLPSTRGSRVGGVCVGLADSMSLNRGNERIACVYCSR